MSTSPLTCFVCITFSVLDGPTVAELLYFIDKPSLILAAGLMSILIFHAFTQAVPCYDMLTTLEHCSMDLAFPIAYLLIPFPF